ncbi:histidine kinase [Belliella sp. DSM 111904]|uniref:Histidine kinase n=1 Tax=Belliella filtrata TaxID=2923435 RepID=A0ABS9V1W0_9BACT|nr:histidine kinase [Belliella filtrata]MCH7410412.1 histidine kinase [Belliella filtrata]
MSKIFIFFTIFALILFTPSVAQQYPVTHYTTLDGLANNAVQAMYVDSRGLLWVGTEHGISLKENGTFKNFYEEDGLAFGSCWAITEDQKGHMWFGSYGGGISRFDGKRLTSFGSQIGLIDTRIRHFYPYQNKIFIGTENGISIIDIETDQITALEETVLDSPQSYVSGFFDHEEYLYYSTYGMGVYRLDPKAPENSLFKVNDHAMIYALEKVSDQIYTSNKGNLDQFDIEDLIKGKSPKFSFGQSIVWDFGIINQENIVLATWGIYANNGGIYRLGNQKFEDISNKIPVDSKTLKSVVYSPNDQKLYLGSSKQGVYAIQLVDDVLYFPYENKSVLGFCFEFGNEAILHHKGFDILQNNSEKAIFIKNEDFKNQADKYLQQRNAYIPKHEDDFFELKLDTSKDDILYYEVHAHDEKYWISSNLGLFVLNQNGDFLHYLPIHTYKIGFTNQGELIETNPYGGVRIYSSLEPLQYTYFGYKEDETTPTMVTGISKVHNKTFFASVFEGLFHYDGTKFFSYQNGNGFEPSKIKEMNATSDGKLILATEFDSIYVVEGAGDFEILEKIPREHIVGKTVVFLESYEDYIFIGTEKGLNIHHNGYVRVLDDEQGLNHMIFLSAKVRENKLYLGTTQGYYTLDLPRILHSKPNKIHLAVSEVLVNQKPLDPDAYSWFAYNKSQISTPFGNQTLLMKFKPVGYRYPDKLAYRYRLKPTDEWSPYSTDAQLFLSYLPYGNFNIEVEVYDQFTGTLSTTQLIQLKITRPFYYSPIFIFAFLALVLYFSFLLYKERIRRLRDKEAITQGLRRQSAETKLEALQSQMNPHFIFNALTSIQLYIVKGDSKNATSFIQRFTSLIRKTLNNSSELYIPIKEEVNYLQDYIAIENQRRLEKISFTFDVESDIDLSWQVPPMLIQPVIENIFMHAFVSNFPGGEVLIILKIMDEKRLSCTVEDNGVGINQKGKFKNNNSKGLDLVKRRIALLFEEEGDYLQIGTASQGGTKVTITIPLKKI